ncbi:pyridoxamine 5'-phosphate oxidase [Mucilaginibacter rubeus]|uniref:Pyridoxamine 5'-phosphate oxidase n=1 Tax=Mucilaginibacter rubeus TaxID=2027860 RepID=A0AAE6JDN1_9SPHI|nr:MULTISPECIES: pyridoxamine 5'-phosphate oxidase family protein [Mucilaginibacter]QEM03625.1 pyridoxamine 5'-phosphate oxidase [Mucilaginibacter rubeus]QEM16236.1 pyridoxamine 5'-phosphate oxidase [Mucilaginibacter gossypii]QTE41005.1 pyridoxamine 5'-phosphate oxidase family protein [Mucilaginibacter rubeus]QTE47608.1 pyridoxamine 5'-phosphate oxidase family protein [Mucilaginibacter rubeus]QTE58999.1 pyridoxamine 5'-phosphate oxidase family protein [Mucilaginibacter rubeus]
MASSIFHRGEKYIQRESGESAMASRNAAMISDKITGSSAMFLQEQQVIYAASVDAEGGLWASVLSGSKGFISLSDYQHLTINLSLILSDRSDIFWTNITEKSGIGLLCMDMVSRRRLRINGRISRNGDLLVIRICQVYPVCPKYIQRRDLFYDRVNPTNNTGDLKDWLSRTDTIFVASADDQGNADMSNRGGNIGFIQLKDERTLRIPDYPGNSMFNTLGNFHVNPPAGILLLDFTNGETIQLSGRAIVHVNEEAGIETGGTERFWDFSIDQVLRGNSLTHFTSRFIDFSPYNP